MPRDPVEGISGHKHYTRWWGMNQRCYNTKDENYPACGGRGIKVDDDWHYHNPKGAFNFIVWVEEQVAKRPVEKRSEPFVVGRRDLNGPYTPENCILTTNLELSQRRGYVTMTLEDVIYYRQYKRQNPKVSLRSMCKVFDIKNVYTLSRCLQGITWANANEVEPPLTFEHHLKKKVNINQVTTKKN